MIVSFCNTGIRDGGGFYRAREQNVKSRGFAAQVSDLTIKSGYRKSNLPKRNSTSDLSSQVLASVVQKIQGADSQQGLFSAIIPGAPNGFLVSEAYGFDVQCNGDRDVVEKDRLLTTYWPSRLGNNHPLRDLCDKFYGSGPRLWSSGADRADTMLIPGASLFGNNPLTTSARKVFDYSDKRDPVASRPWCEEDSVDCLVLAPLDAHDARLEPCVPLAVQAVLRPVFLRSAWLVQWGHCLTSGESSGITAPQTLQNPQLCWAPA